MNAIFFLLPLALLLALGWLGAFFWAVSDSQFDDLEGPRWRVLFDRDA
jgi:cbb3-type cytochrome oxidase maturation protein